jgi:predicted nuclease of predicted toxin-antitoxin system
MMHTPPPKVIHVRVGNMKMKQFYDVLSDLWPGVTSLSDSYKLINVFSDRIEGIT